MINIEAFNDLWDEVPELKKRFVKTAGVHEALVTQMGGGEVSAMAELLPTDDGHAVPFIEILFSKGDEKKRTLYRALCKGPKTTMILREGDDKYRRLSAMAESVHTAVYFFEKHRNAVLEGMITRAKEIGAPVSDVLPALLASKQKSDEALAKYPDSIKERLSFTVRKLTATK